MQPVAFFDVDGTLFRSSLLIELTERLIEEEIFPDTARIEYEDEFEAWRNREGSYEDYIDAVVRSFIKHIKGVYYGDLADIGRQVVARAGRRNYLYTINLIKELKEKNYFLVAISQSPKSILDDYCRQYGFDKVYGRIYEIGPQDHLTGVVEEEHLIANKANIVARVFDNEVFNRDSSIGIGDTEGDITLLESVDRAICFNPNQKLYDYAKQMDWEVVVERKNVIYKL